MSSAAAACFSHMVNKSFSPAAAERQSELEMGKNSCVLFWNDLKPAATVLIPASPHFFLLSGWRRSLADDGEESDDLSLLQLKFNCGGGPDRTNLCLTVRGRTLTLFLHSLYFLLFLYKHTKWDKYDNKPLSQLFPVWPWRCSVKETRSDYFIQVTSVKHKLTQIVHVNQLGFRQKINWKLILI